MQSREASFWRWNVPQLVKAATSFVVTVGSFVLSTGFSALLSPRGAGVRSTDAMASGLAEASDNAPLPSVGNQVAYLAAREVGRWDSPGWAYHVAVEEPYAYLADGPGGLQVLNISDLNHITCLNTLNPGWGMGIPWTGGSARQLALGHQTAFVAADVAGLWVVNLTNPRVPQAQGFYPRPQGDPVTRVNILGDTLVFANNNAPTVTFNAATAPGNNDAFIGTDYQEMRGVTDIFTVDEALYLAYPGLGVTRIHPEVFPAMTTLPIPGVLQVTTQDALGYAVGPQGLSIVDLAVPHVPVLLATYADAANAEGHARFSLQAEVIQVQGSVAYLVDPQQGFMVLNLNGAQTPTWLNATRLPSCSTPRSLSLSASQAWIACGSGGVTRVDVSEHAPQRRLSLATQDAQDVVTEGGFAYVADGRQGIQIFDLKNPSHVYGAYPAQVSANALLLFEGILYVADGGLTLLDVTDPSRPALLGRYATSGAAVDVVVNKPLVVLLDPRQGLVVIDTTNPSDLQSLGIYAVPQGTSLRYVPGQAYITSPQGLHSIRAPLWDLWIPVPTAAMQVAATPKAVYIATFQQLLYTLDQSNVTRIAPVTLPPYTMQGSAREMLAFDDYVLVAEGKNGIEVIDIQDPLKPRWAGQFTANLTDVRGITRQGAYLYVADDAAGLVVLQTNVQPVIQTNQLVIYTNQTVVLTPNLLRAVDPDNPPSEVIWTVQGIEQGYFENQNHPGVALTQFTLADLQQQMIQFVHDGSQKPPTYQISLSDGWLSDGPYVPVVHFNPPPLWLTTKILLQDQENTVVSTLDLNALPFAQSVDSREDDLLLFEVAFLENAYFAWVNPSTVNHTLTQFTKQDLTQGRVRFWHAKTEALPLTRLILSHRGVSLSPQDITVYYTPIDHPPVFDFIPRIVVNQGETTVITSDQFRGHDPDERIPDGDLRFDINQMAFGYFSEQGSPDLINARFNQSQLQLQEGNHTIVFTQPKDVDNVPTYQVQLTKVLPSGVQLSTGFINGTVDYNYAPELGNNSLTLSPGDTVRLTSMDLSATDRDDNATHLYFIPSAVEHGQFLLQTSDNNSTQTLNFTQAEVMQGRIAFAHDGSPEAPAYSISVYDKRMNTRASPATITFLTSHSENPVSAAAVAIPVVVGLGLAGLMTWGFFATSRRRREQQSRSAHPFAEGLNRALALEIKDFQSSEGKRYIEVVDNLLSLLATNGIEEDYLSGTHQDELIQAVADCAKRQLPRQENRWGQPKIQVEALKSGLQSIVDAVVSQHTENRQRVQNGDESRETDSHPVIN